MRTLLFPNCHKLLQLYLAVKSRKLFSGGARGRHVFLDVTLKVISHLFTVSSSIF